MASADKWRWTDEDGVQRLLRAEELRDALVDGRLKPSTLVWRRGMKSWLPAATVPELMSIQASGSGVDDDSTVRRPRPNNLVDIAAIESQRVARSSSGGRLAPAPPKVPEFDDKAVESQRISTSGIDTKWSEAPPPDDTDKTVTRIRSDEDEELTMVAQPSRPSQRVPPSEATVVRSSHAPPVPVQSERERAVPSERRKAPQSRRALPARSGPGKVVQSTGAAGARRAPPGARAVVRSDEVLSHGFGGGGVASRSQGKSRASVSRESGKGPGAPKVVVDGNPSAGGDAKGNVDAAFGQLGRRHHKTAPPPEKAGEQRLLGISAPLLAQEPWQRPSEAPPQPAPTAVLPPELQPAAPAVPGVMPAVRRPDSGVSLPAMMVIAAGTFCVLLLVFFGGRWSAPSPEPVEEKPVASGTEQAAAPAPTVSAASLRPCLMLRAPARWAPYASKSIPFEMLATPAGKLAIAYGRSRDTPRGMLIDPITGVIEARHTPLAADAKLSRVVPLFEDEQVVYQTTIAEQDGVNNAVYVKPSLIVGFDERAFVKLDKVGGTPAPLWNLGEGERAPDALRAVHVPDKGVLVAYRHDKKIYSGWLGPEGKVLREATVVGESNAKLGKPSIAVNEAKLAIVFANKPDKMAAIEMQWSSGSLDAEPETAQTVPLPEGGPGGQAIAPAIAALPQGRWLLMWTEGKTGSRILRAQTYGPSFQAVGPALRVSPATGSFGQGMVGTVGQSAAVVFLLSARRSYEIWGTVLKCD